MTESSFPRYRCVNQMSKEWFRVSLKFSNPKTPDRVTRITINGSGVYVSSFKDFLSMVTIYKETSNGLYRMQASCEENDDQLALTETEEYLSFIDFSSRYKMDAHMMWRNQPRSTKFSPKSDNFVARKSKLADSSNRLALVPPRMCLHKDFIPIETKPGSTEQHPEEQEGNQHDFFDSVSYTALFASSSEEELAKLDKPKPVSDKKGPRGVLKTATSPARKLNVSFDSITEALPKITEENESSTGTSPGDTPMSSPFSRRKLPETMPKSLFTGALWLKACMAPLGKWALPQIRGHINQVSLH